MSENVADVLSPKRSVESNESARRKKACAVGMSSDACPLENRFPHTVAAVTPIAIYYVHVLTVSRILEAGSAMRPSITPSHMPTHSETHLSDAVICR